VADYFKFPEHIFLLCARTDIMDHIIPFRSRNSYGRYNSDMEQPIIQPPCDYISGLIFGIDAERFSPPFKELHKIGNSAVVYIGIGLFEVPYLRILVKIPDHVFMHFFLQVDTDLAKYAYNDIRTYSLPQRQIAAGILQADIFRSILGRHSHLPESGIGQDFMRIDRLRTGDNRKQKKKERNKIYNLQFQYDYYPEIFLPPYNAEGRPMVCICG
jgi:hypothetical protein